MKGEVQSQSVCAAEVFLLKEQINNVSVSTIMWTAALKAYNVIHKKLDARERECASALFIDAYVEHYACAAPGYTNIQPVEMVINPRHACTRVTVVVL